MRRGIVALCLIVAAAACGKSPESRTGQAMAAAGTVKSVKGLVFLTREGCVNTTTMRANLDHALEALGLPDDYQFIETDTLADVRSGYPTPTLLYNNRDVFGMAEPTASHLPAT